MQHTLSTTRTRSPANSSRRWMRSRSQRLCLLPAARHHRQRQDRGVCAPDARCAAARRAGAAAGAGDQSDAATGKLFPQPLPRREPDQPAQRPVRGRASAQLAAGATGRGADRARHAAVGVRRVAETRADHRRRGARQLVQAAGWLALFGARRGDLPRQPARRAHRAGFGHAVAGELSQRAERALPAAQADRARAGRGAPARSALHQHQPDRDAPRHQRKPAARDRTAHRSAANKACCSSTGAAMRRC